MGLSDRRIAILKALIEEYIKTGDPVGSKTVSQLGFTLSSATIRNEMAELENLGYIYQPHTSAGRVPSDLGYRFYVDKLMKGYELSEEDKEIFQKGVIKKIGALDKLIENSAKLISQFTNYATLFLMPSAEGEIKRIDVIPVDRKTFIFLIITTTGMVKNFYFKLSYDVPEQMMEMLGNLFSEHFSGMAVNDISVNMFVNVAKQIIENESQIYPIINAIKEAFGEVSLGDVHLEGTKNMLSFREFDTKDSFSNIISTFENKEKLLTFLQPKNDDTKIYIGSENEMLDIKNASVIMKGYKVKGKLAGSIAIVGPTRMDYAKAIYSIDYFADLFEKLMGDDEE